MELEAWRTLAGLVRAERRQRRMTQAQFAAGVRMDVRILRDIENARRSNYDARTIDKLERVMTWEGGSVQRMKEGREPRKIADPDMAEMVAVWEWLTPRQRKALVELARVFTS